jgi:hypothetical protein
MAAKKTASARKTRHAKQSAPKQRTSNAPRSASKAANAGSELITIDRRRGDRGPEAAADDEGAPKLERRAKVQRRRQIDPTTCERDYSVDEVEFMNAMDEYKRKNGRMFPTCSEVLEVIRSLGYVKLSSAERAMNAVDSELNALPMIDLESPAETLQ